MIVQRDMQAGGDFGYQRVFTARGDAAFNAEFGAGFYVGGYAIAVGLRDEEKAGRGHVNSSANERNDSVLETITLTPACQFATQV